MLDEIIEKIENVRRWLRRKKKIRIGWYYEKKK